MSFFPEGWNEEDMPELENKTIVVTGANSGLGFHATRRFAEKGATVVMACRSMEKGREAKQKIMERDEEADLELMKLDLASLKYVEKFTEKFCESHDELHVLCNNAGLMAIPYQETDEGFEKQFGVNHLGHFYLTAKLFDVLRETKGETRVVNQSSMLHEKAELDPGNIMVEEDYDRWKAYANSKLANILFTRELDKRAKKVGIDVKSVACHPGYADTDLQFEGPRQEGKTFRLYIAKLMNSLLAQSPERGCLPMLYASVSEEVKGGEYIGPDGFKNMRGYPEKQETSEDGRDLERAERLWNVSEELTGKEFDLDSQGLV